MDLTIAACILAALAFLNQRIARSFLYPPVLFCAWWSAMLLLLWCFKDLLYPVGPDGLYIYIIGAIAYSAGALFARWVPSFTHIHFGRTSDNTSWTGTVFAILIVSLIVALPSLALYTRTLAYTSSLSAFWEGVRSSYIEQNDLPGGGALSVANLAPLYIVLSYIAMYELTFKPSYTRRLYMFLGLAFAFQLLTVARANIMQLLVGSIAIGAVRRARLSFRTTAASVLLFVCAFALVQFGLGKLDSDWSTSLEDRASSLARGFAVYAVGGPVAFDYVITHPGHVLNTWKVYKPFVRDANKFGAGLPELSQHLDYTEIGRGLIDNVYTFYFTYYVDFGIPGVIIASVLFGMLSSAVYRTAQNGSAMGTVLYALVVYGIVMSAFAECVALEIQLWFKAAFCVICFYKVMPSLRRRVNSNSLSRFVSPKAAEHSLASLSNR